MNRSTGIFDRFFDYYYVFFLDDLALFSVDSRVAEKCHFYEYAPLA